MVFPTQEMDGTRAVTEIIVRPTDPDTLRVAADEIAQTEVVVPAVARNPEIAFYISNDGPQPLMGADLEWDGGHVWWTQDGAQIRVRKVGYEFDPNGPPH